MSSPFNPEKLDIEPNKGSTAKKPKGNYRINQEVKEALLAVPEQMPGALKTTTVKAIHQAFKEAGLNVHYQTFKRNIKTLFPKDFARYVARPKNKPKPKPQAGPARADLPESKREKEGETKNRSPSEFLMIDDGLPVDLDLIKPVNKNCSNMFSIKLKESNIETFKNSALSRGEKFAFYTIDNFDSLARFIEDLGPFSQFDIVIKNQNTLDPDLKAGLLEKNFSALSDYYERNKETYFQGSNINGSALAYIDILKDDPELLKTLKEIVKGIRRNSETIKPARTNALGVKKDYAENARNLFHYVESLVAFADHLQQNSSDLRGMNR